MFPTLEDQIEGLKRTIAEMEAQRDALGAEVMDRALAPLQHKLGELTAIHQDEALRQVGVIQQQRKLVTLLFMDIAGSTSIAQHMDPEDVGEIFDIALKQLAQPVTAHGGHVTRFMGDGFLAVFGAPTAREEDPEQAVRAGLAILAQSGQVGAELERKWHIQAFQVRVGINTGLVMLGGETEAEDTLMGAAVNLAARLESAAPAGGLLISHDTYRHIRGVFDVEPWEPLTVKGFDEPVKVYRVLRTRPRAFRTLNRGVEGIETRMVGRDSELKYLQEALLSAVQDREGQMVTITGEAGVGKSRLLYEFQDWIELLPPPPVRFFAGRAYPEAQNQPYGLLRNLFASRFQIQEDDQDVAIQHKIVTGFGEILGENQDGEMRSHILGHWLGYDFSASLHLKNVLGDPEQLRNRSLNYLGEYFKGVSNQNPAVIFLEDIHWADDSSLDALSWLGERLTQQRLVIVGAARPTLFERRPYWGEGHSYHRRLVLEPLSKYESRQLVAAILKHVAQVPSELRELVVEGAEGNPFYVEELVKMLIEDGVIVKADGTWHVQLDRLAEIEVPPTLAGVLQARLDSLTAPERTVLQQASVVGRQFWDSVIAYIQAAEKGGVRLIPEALSALRNRELIYRREESAFLEAREYLFKHDILREVTYESVLKRLRKVYHGLVADWLISRGDERASEYSGLIAGHLLRAGRKEQAGEYFLRAGESAIQSYANCEAEAHFRHALELLPDSSLRAPCLAGLGEALIRQGRRTEAVQILQEAIEQFQKVGDFDRVARLYTRLSQVLFYINYQRAWEACREGLGRLEGSADGHGLARLLAETGRIAYFHAKSKAETLAICQQAIVLADDLGDLEAKVAAHITIATCERDSNPDQSCQILQNIIMLSEANKLWDLAARACTTLGVIYDEDMLNPEKASEYFLKTMEIAHKLSDIDRYLNALGNLEFLLIEIGLFKGLEEKREEFLRRSSASPTQVEEYMNEIIPWHLCYKGSWEQASVLFRNTIKRLREETNTQISALYNVLLSKVCLELNSFANLTDLSEAEEALQENLKSNRYYVSQSRYLLVAISSRNKNFAKAHEQFVEADNASNQPELISATSFRLDAESELARAEKRWDEAIAAFQALIALYQSRGHHWQHARRLIDLGDAYQGRNLPEDQEKAREIHQQSLAMFIEIGAPGYIRVLEERLARSEPA